MTNQLTNLTGNTRTYPNPGGLPFYWQDEVSGQLAAAINALLDHKVDGAPAPNEAQLSLIQQYLDHYIHAPCWEGTPLDDELAELRRQAPAIKTVIDIDAFISKALAIGLDPL